MENLPNNIHWHEPTAKNVRDLQGDVPLVMVADNMGTWSHDGDEDSFGDLDITIDKDACLIFTFNGGGPAPYDEWTIIYWCDAARTVVHAQILAELIFSEIVNKTISPATWDAHTFHKEDV